MLESGALAKAEDSEAGELTELGLALSLLWVALLRYQVLSWYSVGSFEEARDKWLLVSAFSSAHCLADSVGTGEWKAQSCAGIHTGPSSWLLGFGHEEPFLPRDQRWLHDPELGGQMGTE